MKKDILPVQLARENTPYKKRTDFSHMQQRRLNIHSLLFRGLKFIGVTEVGEGFDLRADHGLCLKCCTTHDSLKQNI